MNKWAELFVGLILVIVSLVVAFYSKTWIGWGISFNFWTPAGEFLKGGIFWVVFLVGALFILLGISDIKG
jgi:hypothetical protein